MPSGTTSRPINRPRRNFISFSLSIFYTDKEAFSDPWDKKSCAVRPRAGYSKRRNALILSRTAKSYFLRRTAAGSGGFQVHASEQAFWMPRVSDSFFNHSRGTRAHSAEFHQQPISSLSSPSSDRTGEPTAEPGSPGPGGAGQNTGAAGTAYATCDRGYLQPQIRGLRRGWLHALPAREYAPARQRSGLERGSDGLFVGAPGAYGGLARLLRDRLHPTQSVQHLQTRHQRV